ncbi:MarR family winged helix-turn-helix transcriptional regulator [Streptomyces sp. NPDC101118]|uniref:MarR family winged helix-turn-helix transcriptional regulator n=1 Tax=Streptomyces sp. NPDC101118 TaxID=3366109 RepID=UPI0037F321DD
MILRLARAHWAAASPLLGRIGLYPGQELLLMRLWENDHQSQSALANALKLDRSTVTRTVQRLEQQGLITRETAPDDRRSVIVSLTSEGRALRSEVERAWADLETITTAGMSERQRTEALRLLRRMERNLVEPRGA